MINRLKNYLRSRKTMDELYSLTDRELSDIGINRTDIPRISRSYTK